MEDAVQELKWAWWLLLIAGLLGITAGIIVLVQPGISLVTLAVLAGIFLLVDAIFEIAGAIAGSVPGRGMLALLGVLSAIVGVLLMRHPINGVVAIALLLGLWMLTMGVVRAMTAFEGSEQRGWNLLLAALEVIAGIVIVSSPDIGVATLALFIGISFIARGIGMCMVAWMLRAAKHELRTPPSAAPVTWAGAARRFAETIGACARISARRRADISVGVSPFTSPPPDGLKKRTAIRGRLGGLVMWVVPTTVQQTPSVSGTAAAGRPKPLRARSSRP